MKLEDSKYAGKYKQKISYHFCNVYIFDNFVVNEINEGINFNWEHAEQILKDVYEYIDPNDESATYISNRVNSYSVSPQDWLKFYTSKYNLKHIAVVSQKESGFISIVLERIFAKANFRKFTSLEDAISWAEKRKHTNELSS